jgi:hypothetical protein
VLDARVVLVHELLGQLLLERDLVVGAAQHHEPAVGVLDLGHATVLVIARDRREPEPARAQFVGPDVEVVVHERERHALIGRQRQIVGISRRVQQ